MKENLTSHADSRIYGEWHELVRVQILRETATKCPRNSTRIPHKRPVNSAKRREDGKNYKRKNAHEIKESRTTYYKTTRWSGWRDSNPRPLDPQSSALPDCATARSANGRQSKQGKCGLASTENHEIPNAA